MKSMKELSLGIVGGGVVGQATARSYIEHVKEVRVHDILPERRTDALRRVLECDLVMVCLPTPQCKDSLQCDLSAVEGFFKEMYPLDGKKLVSRLTNWVLRSTVPIGTTLKLRDKHSIPELVHSPEFLTARCATIDAQIPARNIIGSRERGDNLQPTGCARVLHCLYAERFPHVPILSMTSDESEAVKLMQNSAFAVKVAFWNELRSLTDKLGLDWETVRGAVLADGRIHPSHTQVPGQDGLRGFGGSCLPKDLANMIQCQVDSNQGPCLTHAAMVRNVNDRKKGSDS